jgi:predicted MPP superfamily phosphohydrolase
MNRITLIPILLLLFLLIDFYAYQAVKTAFHGQSTGIRRAVFYIYWSLTAVTMAGLLSFLFVPADKIGSIARNFIISAIIGNLLTKLLIVIFLFIDDLQRLFRWLFAKALLYRDRQPLSTPVDISRSEFIMKAGLLIAAIPPVAMGYGIISGAHDYRVRRQTLLLKNLPPAFDGLRILQISDIHSGSFFNKTAVKGGVEMILREKANVVFFTGDLVNNEAGEMKEYFDIFKKIKAPLGVFSTLGNHDYGDYYSWNSAEDKRRNLATLINIHKEMGWDILIDEHRFLGREGENLAIIGIQNWGAGKRWPKYGKLDKAYQGTAQAPVKLLLSHDPSHWDAQVRPEFGDIDVMFSGHTHGFQFGIEAAGIKWSPVQYMYKQWGGLYKEGSQQLYVNRGFGYLGFPGRVGMPPEITVFELKKA